VAPRKKKPSGPTQVDAIVHGDKRTNIPTADAQDFVAPEAQQPIKLLYPRDPSLDPQLVWKGKDAQDADDLEVTAPPIFIQEKIDPRVLVENLRQTAKAGEDEPELTLFESFDGLNEMDVVDFYRHDANWSNRMILGDSLQVMASLAEREALRGKVQMIYMDPPYGIKFGSNWQVSTRKRDVKDGKLEDASFEVEQIKAFRDTWESGIHSYLSYLRDRLVVARELLTESGSCFVQIGDENVHLVRSLMDEVFGDENFVSQITYMTTSSATSAYLAGVGDYILWFAKDIERVKYRQLYSTRTIGGQGASKYTTVEEPTGVRRPVRPEEVLSGRVDGRLLRLDNLTSQTIRVGKTTVFDVEIDGRRFRPRSGGWKTNSDGMARLLLANRVAAGRNSLSYVRYFDDFPAFPLNNSWSDIGGVQSRADPKVYVVQTSSSAISRCMLMTTDAGDLVMDPTCGSGTTSYVAEQWGRRWIVIDTSRVALALARQRVMGSQFPYYLLADSPEGRKKEASLTANPPPPDTPTGDIRHGFVFGRVQHITLRDIATNPDIKEGMSRAEIDAAIKRHADFELLYDKPYEDKKKVRVAGPFTVESLSPHRSLAFSGEAPDDSTVQVSSTEAAADLDSSSPGFEQMILDNLAKAGVQNGRRNERLSFASIEAYPGTFVQAVGERVVEDGAAPVRVGIAIGPQYGTVGPSFIENAAKEAIRAPELDLLAVLAFAFDPQALGTEEDYISSDEGFEVGAERSLGRMPVLLVRMNNDLVMGEDLKKTGAGNLFTVFGEPDIEITSDGDEVTVEIRGVDVYDPSTGEVRSRDTDHIALWMIDTNYNEESFFVRHCYFTGGNDPYAKLKRALKADIDEDAWASMYSTTSRPFPKPTTGKIAVKVINDYGDEVMQVFDVA
jgi:adenine-specific DNA-methyltransferase